MCACPESIGLGLYQAFCLPKVTHVVCKGLWFFYPMPRKNGFISKRLVDNITFDDMPFAEYTCICRCVKKWCLHMYMGSCCTPQELSLILNTFCAPPSPSSSSCCVSTSHYFTLTILIFVWARSLLTPSLLHIVYLLHIFRMLTHTMIGLLSLSIATYVGVGLILLSGATFGKYG